MDFAGGATALTVAGTDLSYQIYRMHVSAGTADTITITDGTNTLWGPHAIPAGFGNIDFSASSEPGDSGLIVGKNKMPYITAVAGFTGEITLLMWKVPYA